MTIKTDDGINIYVLPDNAKCKLCGLDPFYAEVCPLSNCSICYPNYCEFYSEESEEEE